MFENAGFANPRVGFRFKPTRGRNLEKRGFRIDAPASADGSALPPKPVDLTWVQAVGALPKPANWLWLRQGEAVGVTMGDSSGGAHNGTYSGATVTLGQAGGPIGDPDTAAKYQGASPLGTVPFAAFMDSVNLFTVILAFKTVALVGANNCLAARDTQAAGRRWQISIAAATGFVNFGVFNSTSVFVNAIGAVNRNDSLYHLLIAQNNFALPTNRQRLYIDNTLEAVNTSSLGALATLTPSFQVGNVARTTQAPANSILDEVIFLPGIDISAIDRQALWDAFQ